MRYSPAQKQETAEKILAAAERGFRLAGYGGAGVDGLAQDAGVTSGAFYKHFPSKAAAFEATIVSGLNYFQKFLESCIADPGKDWLVAVVDYYLSQEHRSNLAGSCVVPSLSSEVCRGGEQLRSVYQHGIEQIVATLEKGMPDLEATVRRQRAWTILSMLSGGVQIARAVHDVQQADEIAAALRVSVLQFGRAP
jgi:TetR/AcrR family transcriptional repressor of nem operon